MSNPPLDSTCRSSPTKRRRSRADIDALRLLIENTLQQEHPQTVRQLYYQLVTLGAIEKTEQEYKGTVCRLLGLMRRDGSIPFWWLADNTRWQLKPKSFSSLDRMLEDSIRLYRRDLWESQEAYCEIWLEKDALSGVLYQETEQWDVRLMVTRGYPSLTFLHSAAESIAFQEKPAFIYYFGDYDPSGLDITRAVEEGLREFAPEADITFERVAVSREQIERWQLPSRPTKKSDSRAKRFKGESTEVDAIPPARLRELARECIERHLDLETLSRTRLAESVERNTLRKFIDGFREGGAA